MRLLLVCLLVAVPHVRCARILGIFPTPSISHQLPFQAVMKALASRGHDVTVLSPDPLKSPHANYTDIDLSFTYDLFRQHVDANMMGKASPYQTMEIFSIMAQGTCHAQLASDVVQKFIKSNPTFDLVFIESLMYQCMHGLIHHVGSPPMIGILSMGAIYSILESAGNPHHPAYVPDMSWPYTDHMTFWERLNNMIFGLHMSYTRHARMLPAQERVMRQYFGAAPPSVSDSDRNYSLVMLNDHWGLLGYVKPLLPTVIELGSLHTQDKSKPLPQDLQQFLDGAKDGFVYFSLGSNVRSDKLPPHVVQQLLEAFAELPLRVLWKWEADALPGQPGNVKVGKWLPQQDVLAHPNIRLFITQGGLQSLQEAIFNEVPLLGIPFFGDQPYNIRKIVTAGVGLQLHCDDISKDSVLTAVRELVNNPSYLTNMKKMSAISKDQPETALQRAVWWTEYVLRHNGTKHMRTAALDLAWYQYLLLDVVAFIVVAVLLALFMLYFIVKKLCCLTCRLMNGKCSTSKRKSE